MSEDKPEYEYPGTPFPSSHLDSPRTCQRAEERQPNQQPSKPPIYRRLTFWDVAFNGCLVAITFLLMLIAMWQLDATNQAISTSTSANNISNEALRVSRQSALISEEALRMSKESAEDEMKNFHMEQRAWVGPMGMNVKQFGQVDGKKYIKAGEKWPLFGAEVSNLGRSPAKKVRHRISIKGVPNNLPFKAIYEKQPTESTSVLFPNMKMTLPIPRFDQIVTEEQIKVLTAKTEIMYIYGQITYEDVFSKPHETTFCMYLQPSLDTFSSCRTYNNAD